MIGSKHSGQRFQTGYFLIFTAVAAGVVLVAFGNTLFAALGADKTSCDLAILSPELRTEELAWPVDHSPRVVISCFGKRDCNRKGEVCHFGLNNNRGITILTGHGAPVFSVAAGKLVDYSVRGNYVIIDHKQQGFKAKYKGLDSLCNVKAPPGVESDFSKEKEKGEHIGNSSGLLHLEFYEEEDDSRQYFDPLSKYNSTALAAYNINFSVDSACVYWSQKPFFKDREYIDYANKTENQWEQSMPPVTG